MKPKQKSFGAPDFTTSVEIMHDNPFWGTVLDKGPAWVALVISLVARIREPGRALDLADSAA